MKVMAIFQILFLRHGAQFMLDHEFNRILGHCLNANLQRLLNVCKDRKPVLYLLH